MPLVDQHVPVISWTEPDGIAVRGTVVVIPGRGEQPAHYERFGRRIAADGYRVHAVADPTRDAAATVSQLMDQLAVPESSGTTGPRVLVGSDTGALFAAGLAATGQVPGLDALVLAGLPAAETGPGRGRSSGVSWEDELDTRTACPAHRARLSGTGPAGVTGSGSAGVAGFGGVRPGALYEPVPEGWAERADLRAVTQPILGIHGADDPVSPLAAARVRYAAASAELVVIAGGRHDALNDVTHRTVAATIVLFLERLRLGPDLPLIARRESLGQAR